MLVTRSPRVQRSEIATIKAGGLDFNKVLDLLQKVFLDLFNQLEKAVKSWFYCLDHC